VYHPQNEHVLALDAVNNHVLTYGKASHPCAEIPIAGSSSIGKPRQKVESVSDGVNQPCGDIYTAALLRCLEPDVIQIDFGPWRNAMGH
jgi:hypothetical protein